MTNINMTNPCNTPNTKKPRSASCQFWDYKEQFVVELQKLQVPLRPAEVASIGMTTQLSIAKDKGLTAAQTAKLLYNDVVKIHTNKDGTWRYCQGRISV